MFEKWKKQYSDGNGNTLETRGGEKLHRVSDAKGEVFNLFKAAVTAVPSVPI